MNVTFLKKELSSFALSLFRQDFFGIYHGSISAKSDKNMFIINIANAVFDNLSEDSLIELHYQKDYRWKSASIDASIHYEIYKNISDAKFITFTMPPFTTAYSLNHTDITPLDYFGHQELNNITIYDPKNFDDWYDRAATEITKKFLNDKTNIIIIKGYGVYAYHRDLNIMAKRVAILEKSCRLLMLQESTTLTQQ